MKKFLITSLMLSSTYLFAGQCDLTFSRIACKGKEIESYSKCPEGKKTCTLSYGATSKAECANLSVSNCVNGRTDITKYKSVQAAFDGQVINNGDDFCLKDQTFLAADGTSKKYVKSVNYPYVSLPSDQCN